MRFLRTIVIALTVLSAGVFAYYQLQINSQYDENAPVIIADTEEITVSVTDGDDVLLEGMTAEDDRDGDVTDSLIVESHSKFVADGKRKVTYAAFDAAGNVGTFTRTIEYTDYAAPTFKLTAPLRYSVESASITPTANIEAYDCLDGNITTMIKYKYGEGSYVYSEGETLISFQVSDSAGATSVVELYVETLKESEYEKAFPLLSDFLVYTNVGEALNPADYLIGVQQSTYYSYIFADHTEDAFQDYTVDDISITGDVDYNTPGTYRVIYTLSEPADENGKSKTLGSVSLYIVVR